MDSEEFISQWHEPGDTIIVRTSGSTGVPKEVEIKKSRMWASAKLTCDFLQLKPGDRALLCMSADYIAGKMMIVRSMERQLALTVVPPSGDPFATLDDDKYFDLVAMVPLQVYNVLRHEHSRKRLMQCRHVLIGGGAIDRKMEMELRCFPNNVWSTYGMTETLSHIALRKLNGVGNKSWYRPFDGIRVWVDENECLVIDAPMLHEGVLYTTDRAVLRTYMEDGEEKNEFRILGRADNVVCSGGVKIQIEEAEAVLAAHTQEHFVLTAVPDEKFGEKLVLMVEEGGRVDWNVLCTTLLPKYWQPKHVYTVQHIPLTPTGKPARNEIRRVAEHLHVMQDHESKHHS